MELFCFSRLLSFMETDMTVQIVVMVFLCFQIVFNDILEAKLDSGSGLLWFSRVGNCFVFIVLTTHIRLTFMFLALHIFYTISEGFSLLRLRVSPQAGW